MTGKSIEQAFIDDTITALQQNKLLAERAVAQLSDEQLHQPLDANTNSIAIIMKHVAGNLISRWTDFLTTDGEKPWRNRDGEFVDTFTSRQEVLEFWEQGWRRLFDTLRELQAEDFSKVVTIAGVAHSVPLAIQRAVTHCGYHIGQIVMVARILAVDNWETLTVPRAHPPQST